MEYSLESIVDRFFQSNLNKPEALFALISPRIKYQELPSGTENQVQELIMNLIQLGSEQVFDFVLDFPAYAGADQARFLFKVLEKMTQSIVKIEKKWEEVEDYDDDNYYDDNYDDDERGRDNEINSYQENASRSENNLNEAGIKIPAFEENFYCIFERALLNLIDVAEQNPNEALRLEYFTRAVFQVYDRFESEKNMNELSEKITGWAKLKGEKQGVQAILCK